jgi:hypothetical protein
VNKIVLPPSECRFLFPEIFSIAKQPNMPTCHDYNFHEEGLPKTSFGPCNNCLQIIRMSPFYLKVIPNMPAEITIKKEMYPIFIDS